MMRKWRKYPFFAIIIVSSLLYGGGRLIRMGMPSETTTVQEVHTPGQNDAAGQPESGEPETVKKTGGEEGKAETVQKTEEQSKTETVQRTEEQSKAEEEQGAGEETKTETGQEGTGKVLETEETIPEEREFQRVEMDYLEDALFIGDSRTSTLYEYAGWDNTDFFVKYGQTVWDVWDSDMDGITLEQMLTAKKYGKIYIMLGINELGRGTAETFAAQFGSVVSQIRQLQPDAVIFVEAIMHVTQSKDDENTYINNQEINARNEQLKLLADNRTIFYIDVNEVMDEPGTGKLKQEYSFDGVHLQVKYIEVWREFLLDHGIR